MKFHAGGRPDCSLALKSWTKFPEAAVDGGQRPALKRLVDEVEKDCMRVLRFCGSYCVNMARRLILRNCSEYQLMQFKSSKT
ncbi:hypothetical protein DAI22_11g237800 [Oryza sativa Japonica Group]|nr:hypothetical protein DAI22_11g237800 [Oryza sativa Japonica Group]